MSQDLNAHNALWSAVIIQALQDLCVWRNSGYRRGEKTQDAIGAMKFIFSDDLRCVCSILDIEPVKVRIAARKILAGRLKRELRKISTRNGEWKDFFS